MFFKLFYILIHLALNSNGFLLNDRSTPSTARQGISEEQYNVLMDSLTLERHARLKLEDHLSLLKQELLTTQKGLTDIYNNSTINCKELETKTADLETKYESLLKHFDSLSAKFNTLEINNTITENYAKQLEQKIASLMQLKSVNNLQTLMTVKNDTKHLEQELQITNNKLSAVVNDVDARKQDFIALFNTEQNLERSLRTIETNLNSSNIELANKIDTVVSYYNKSQYNLMSMVQQRMKLLENEQNVTAIRLLDELHTMSNRVALTAFASDKIYTDGDTILFPYVKTKYGVSYTTISTLGTTGKFKCEKAGLYLISAAIMTDTNGFYIIYKNSNILHDGYFSLNGNFQTSTVVLLTQLLVNDTIYIQNIVRKRIVGNQFSSITFLQLAE